MLKNLKSTLILAVLWGLMLVVICNCSSETQRERSKVTVRPNFLILMSDNHSHNHVGAYGDPVVKTPNIDRIAKEGVLFTHAFCQSPSCTPARAAMLTGRDVWQLREGANLWGSLPSDLTVYTQLLEEAGYHVGIEGKGWGPGNHKVSGWEKNPGGERYSSFEEFYSKVNRGQPWCYWFSSRAPHRPYGRVGGKKAKIDLEKIEVPEYLPDNMDVRGDMADYYSEIQAFDDEVAHYLSLVDEMGQLENTVVVICSDNGWQMPRGLANLYDFGTRIPLIISWPRYFKGDREVDDFVLMNDFAPTFLELAGLPIPEAMTAKSLVGILESEKSGVVEEERNFVVLARERHAFVRANGASYPARAIRTKQYLYIRNYEPDRWPAGDPPLYGDVDAHMLQYPSPTKMYMLVNRDERDVKPLFELAFGKRPAEELFDLSKDPDQMNNVAEEKGYQEIKNKLSSQLTAYLAKTGDPREGGPAFNWDEAAYYMEADKTPKPGEEAKKALGLEDEYSYLKQ
jgi:N-sulfoglucosamine sulfohydrolase